MATYSNIIFNSITDFLRRDDWHFTTDEEDGEINFGISLKSRLKSTKCRVLVRNDCYMVFANCSISVDENDADQMAKMAEFTCRANYGLRNGNFELDFRDGELRYKSFVDCDNLVLSDEVIRDSVVIPASMLDKYAEGILGILFMNMDAERAIALCEK